MERCAVDETRLWAGLVDAAGGEEAQAKLTDAVCILASRPHRHCMRHSSGVSGLQIGVEQKQRRCMARDPG